MKRYFSKINWKQTVGEIALIFISITLALLFDNWNQNRQDRQTERQYLTALRDDLEADIESLNSFSERAQQHILGPVERAAEQLMQNNLGDGDTLQFVNNLTMSVFFNTIRLHDATYRDLTGSGNLNLISNFEIRQQLLDYHSALEFYKFYYRGMWDYRLSTLSTTLNRKIPFRLHTRNFDYTNLLPAPDKSVDLDALFDDLELENSILAVVLMERWQQNSFASLLEQAESLKQLIQNEL